MLRLVHEVVARRGREDLLVELDRVADELALRPTLVACAGGPGTGTTSLVNALLGAPVLPAGVRTVAPSRLRHAPAYTATVVSDDATHPGVVRHDTPPLGDALRLPGTDVNPANAWAVRIVEVGLPSVTLADGLVLIDTPPITSAWSAPTRTLLCTAGTVDAVVWTTSAAAPLTAAELDVLRMLATRVRTLIVAVTNADRFSGALAVAREDEVLLGRRGIDAVVVGVSSLPYWGPGGGIPPGPDPGVRAVAGHLERLVAEATQRRITASLGDAFAVTDRLRFRLGAEYDLLDPPRRGPHDATDRSLDQAVEAARVLCSDEAEWARLLDDGRSRVAHDVERDVAAALAERAAEVGALPSHRPGADDLARVSRHLADAIVHVERLRSLALRSLCRDALSTFARGWDAVVGLLDPDTTGRLSPSVERPDTTPGRDWSELPAMRGEQLEGGRRETERRDPRRWLAEARLLLTVDDAQRVAVVADELARRCRARALDLYRDLAELQSTAALAGELHPDAVLRRCDELEEELLALRALDRDHARPRAPRLGY